MFFDQVQKLCAERGISVTKLAEELDLSTSTTNGWRNGAVPRPATLKKVADYFGVTTEYLLTGEGPKTIATNIQNSNVIQNVHAPVMIKNGVERELSEQEIELLRIFKQLNVKKRVQLLSYAYKLEDESK